MKGCKLRFFDIVFSCLGLLVLFPVLLIVAVILRFTGEGEIFFIQQRVGQYGKHFGIFKFATMLKDSPTMGSGTITSKNDRRILPVGKFLRKSKLNELPQLFNILIGHMSLIGPRPHVPRDLEGVSKDVLEDVLKLKPGLSGVASLVFRDEETIIQSFEDPRELYDSLIAPYKAELELWYFKNVSMRMYFLLIVATFGIVLLGRQHLIYKLIRDLPTPSRELQELLKLNL